MPMEKVFYSRKPSADWGLKTPTCCGFPALATKLLQASLALDEHSDFQNDGVHNMTWCFLPVFSWGHDRLGSGNPPKMPEKKQVLDL